MSRKSKDKRSYKNCCAAGCVSTTMSSHLTFFSLPADKERRRAWLKLIRREDIDEKISTSTHHRVCENHFDEESVILTPVRKVLKKGAEPNRMLPRRGDGQKFRAVVSLTQLCSHCQAFPKEPLTLLPETSTDQTDSNFRRRKRIEHTVFSELCKRFLTKKLAGIVKEQIDIIFNYRGKKYSPEYMMFCQNIFHTSPEAYGLLRDALSLPTETSLNQLFLPITKQVNHMIEALRPRIARLTDKEKDCALVIDAISLKANLVYVVEEDEICGFHELEECQTKEIAEYGLVAAIQGIFADYQQPVSYALLHGSKTEEHVYKWIDRLIRQLCEVGLNVRVLISGTNYNFLNSAKRRRVSIENPYFSVNNKKVYYMFDPSHLMMLMRDSLMNYDFYFKDEDIVATWDDIRQFYEKDAARKLRIAPKLTTNHVNPSDLEKTQAKFAVEVFSATVAAAISVYADLGGIDENVEGTVRLLTKMNDIAQFFNLSSRYNIEYRKDFCDEIYKTSFINSMVDFFTEFQVVDKNNGADVSSLLTCVHAFQITLKSILNLYKDLEIDGTTHILSRKLNKDFLDNFFDNVKKNAESTEPTSRQMVTEFRKSYLEVFFKTPKPIGDSTENISNMTPIDQDLLSYESHIAKKRKIVADAENHVENSSSCQQRKDLYTCLLAIGHQENNDTAHQIKQEHTTPSLELDDNSCSSYTLMATHENTDTMPPTGEENDQGDLMQLIKQEEEAFLAMDIELKENKLTTPSSKEKENDGNFPIFKQDQGNTRTTTSTLEEGEDVLSYDSILAQVLEGKIKYKYTLEKKEVNRKLPSPVKLTQDNKVEMEPADKTEYKYLSHLITQEQNYILTMIHTIDEKRKRNVSQAMCEEIHDIDFSTLYLPKNNALLYICGCLLEKGMALHADCSDIKVYAHINLLATQNPDERRFSRYNDYCKYGGIKLLVAPPDSFVEYIEKLDKIFCGLFKASQITKHTVVQSLLKNCKIVNFLMPCKCFPDKFTKILFFRARLLYTLNHNNRVFNQGRGRPQFAIPSL